MPSIAVDTVVSWLAAAAILAYLWTLRGAGKRSRLETKLLFLLVCLASLFTIRGFFWTYGGEPLKILTFVPATLLPLAATLFVESLLRRHASRPLKYFVFIGTILVFVANLLVGEVGRWYFFKAFSVFTILTLSWLFWMVMRRDRAALSPAENAAIRGLTAAIALAFLVALTDFRIRPDWLHLKVGGLGGLIFIYTCVRLIRKGPRSVGREVGAMVLATLILGASMILLITDPSRSEWIEGVVLALAFVLFFAIVDRLRSLALLDRGHGLRHWLLTADLDNLEGFLSSLDDLPLAERHLILGDSMGELEGFDAELMASAFDESGGIWTVADLRTTAPSTTDPMATEQLLALLESYGMGQVALVSRSPCRFLLLSLPDVASAREWLQELAIVQRLALSLDARSRR